ncbi:MAG: TrkH family potassium uptake protein [Clostridia bacterium]|nr:TrkH family potassium uptake protein [Clostridia bacterium]
MNYRVLLNYIGKILTVEGLVMLPALLIAFVKSQQNCVFAFGATIGLLIFLGLGLSLFKPKDQEVKTKEGFIIVSFSWILLSLFGALPFLLSKEIPNYIDCIFETVSGFTTTGSSILTNIEAMSSSLLYWRSFTHWLGGMGILVFFLAIMPKSKAGGSLFRLMKAEAPGPEVGKLAPKLAKTARILYIIYITLTLLEIILLLCGGMSLFDSVTTSFGTAGTGGFGIKNDSLMGYNSYIQIVVGVFMLIFGVNFNIYYLILLKDFINVWKNQELRMYLGIVTVSTIAIGVNIATQIGSFAKGLHHGFFQVASIITTTGYATADFNSWPQFSRFILVFLMFIGACAGSTGGGIKVSRVIILLKSARNTLQKIRHPKSVKTVMIDKHRTEDTVISGVNAFMTVYCIITIVSILIISLDNFSFETTTTSVISCLNNIGPGLDMVGPKGNYSQFSWWAKLVLSADMLLGRLEIFPLIILFSPVTWRKNK